MDRYMLWFEQIHLIIWMRTFKNLDKYILQFWQIHFTIWTNTFNNLDKYIWNFEKNHYNLAQSGETSSSFSASSHMNINRFFTNFDKSIVVMFGFWKLMVLPYHISVKAVKVWKHIQEHLTQDSNQTLLFICLQSASSSDCWRQ